MEGGDFRMSNVDQRVVQMQFDNKQFEAGVSQTLSSLDALNKGLKLEGATKGLNDVSTAASRFSLAGIGAGVDTIASKFKSLGTIGVAALVNISSQAVIAGERMLKSLTLDHLTDGLNVYETKINAIQTILANTASEGTKLPQVTAALAELNKYANLTVFSFGDMAKNIGTFTAAGVDLKTSVASIKGIANLAALSGSSAEQASTAMYQLSQAIAAGSVKLQDWNSVVNAGMGGKVFQTALENTARAMGIHIDAILKKAGSFRQSLQEGWLTSDVLTKTLAQFTGDLSAAQLKAMGFTDKEAQSILAMGQAAVKSATDIRTVTQLQAALKEEVATAWASVWETLIGNITDATSLLSNVHNVLENAFTKPVYALNTLLQEWAKLGGRTAAINTISNALKAIGAIIKPIKDAFHEIFPPATAKQLYDLTKTLEAFTAKLKIGADTADKIKRTFAGLFAVLGIGWDIVKAGAKFLARMFGAVTKGSGGFLDVTAKIGDFLVALKAAIEQGQGIELFFERLGNFIEPILKLVGLLAHALAHVFEKFDPTKAAAGVENMLAKLEPLTRMGDIIAAVWSSVISGFGKVYHVFEPLAQKFADFFKNFTFWVENAFTGVNYQNILSTINTGLFAGLVVLIKKFYDRFKSRDSLGKGLFDSIKEAIEGLTNTLKTMQTTLRAATLLEIALAVAALTVSAVALSKIDSAGLTRALTAMSVMFGQLMASLAVIEKIPNNKGFAKLAVISAAMILLAVAIDLLTVAVTRLSKIDMKMLARGVQAVGILMGELVVTMRLMPAKGLMVSSGLGIIALAAAINILVSAVQSLSAMSWGEIAKGLTGVAALLVSLALFTKFAEAGKTGVLSGAGIILLAAGIKILASAMKDISGLSWESIAKGIVTLAGSLLIIAVALDAIPPTAALGAAGVLIVAISLGKIAVALDQMGKMSWGAIGKGLTAMLGAITIISLAVSLIPPTAPAGAAAIWIVAQVLGKVADVLAQMAKMSWGDILKSMVVLAASLGIIAIAVTLMSGALGGAAALLVVAASLAILTPILITLGKLSWGEIVKGLVALAGVFVVIGVAGLVLAPIVPILLGLGAAIVLLGIGMLAAGAGLLLFSTGLTALSVAGAAGVTAIVAIVSGLIGLLPMVAKEIGLAIIAFAEVIATAGPAITKALTTVLLAVIDALIKLTPKIVVLLGVLLDAMISLAIKYIPKFVDAGLKIITGILNGIADNMPNVLRAGTRIVVNFLEGIGDNLPKVIQAGFDMIIKFLNGLADAINKNTKPLADAGWNLAKALIDGIVNGFGDLIQHAVDAAVNVAKKMWNAAMDFLGISSPSKRAIEDMHWLVKGMAIGLEKNSPLAETSATNLAKNTMEAMTQALSALATNVGPDLNITPVITPVVDMTGVADGASQINKVLGGMVPINLSGTVARANDASVSGQTSQNGSDSQDAPPGTVIFNQTNNSPKPLNDAEIYRQTNNQLSVARTRLAPAKGGA
jgi:tape measure domain-containing protein